MHERRVFPGYDRSIPELQGGAAAHLQVPVVVDRLEVEGIDGREVPDVRGGGLVGHVDRMREGQVPYGEGLELGIARVHAPLLLVVELGQAGGQLSAVGAGPGHDHDLLVRQDVLVGPVALLAHDGVHVRGVAFGETVGVHPDAAALQAVLELLGRFLPIETRDDHGPHGDIPRGQVIDHLQRIGVVGDAEVPRILFRSMRLFSLGS